MSFDVLFGQNCAGCHGTDGKLGPAPPLNDPLFRALVPDEELLRVVTEGRPGTLMPAFATSQGGPLTAEQIKVLAAGLKQRWGSAAPAPSGAPPYLPTPTQAGRAGAGNKEEGLKVFARACAGCHGKVGEGVERDGRLRRKIHDPVFLALISDQELRRYVITGRPDLGMPDYADEEARPEGFKPLTAQEVTDLVALLASWRQDGEAQGEGK
jgi:cytochrome c oxidase cbb3-type subunit 3/ubiquinol-cytochrome c reductase cytochrome c subunit